MKIMKNKKLLVSVLAVILAASACFMAVKGKQGNLDLQYADGYKAVYSVISEKQEDIQTVADKMAGRLNDMNISGNVEVVDGKVNVSFAAKEDAVETIREFLKSKGEVSLRSTEDELLVDAGSLAERPLSIGVSSDINYVSIAADDSNDFYLATLTLASSRGMMVLWVDYDQDKDGYEKENPNYLAACTVTQGYTTGASFPTEVEVEKLRRYAAAANNPLPCNVTETSFEPVKAANGNYGSEYIAVIAGCVLAAAGLLPFAGKVSFVSMFMALLYAVTVLFVSAKAGIIFNSDLIFVIGAVLTVALAYQAVIISKIRKEILRGRNTVYSVKKGYKDSFKGIIEDNLLVLFFGFVAFVAFAFTFSNDAQVILLAALASVLFNVVLFRVFVMNMAEGGMADYSFFNVKKEEIPDVEKGENYQPKESTFNYLSIAKLPIGVIAAVAGAVLFFACGKLDNLLYAVIVATIAIVAVVVYTAVSYKRYYTNTALDTVLAGFVVAFGLGTLTKSVGFAMLMFAVCIYSVTTMMGQLKADYRAIAKEKVNNEKIEAMLNSSLNEYISPLFKQLVIGAAIYFVLAGMIFTSDAVKGILAAAGTVGITLVTLFTVAYFWLHGAENSLKASKTAKKGKADKSEAVITGINNVK